MLATRSELLEKIRLGEDSFLELKEVRFTGEKIKGPTQEKLANELAAFANSAGGVLLLGVEDTSREVIGIPLERLDAVETLVFQACQQSIKPPLAPIIERMMLPDSTGVERAVIRVAVKPSLFVHQSPEGYLHRIGSSVSNMPPEQLVRLFQQRSQSRLIRFDETPVAEATLNDMDEELWRRFASVHNSDTAEVLLSKLAMLAHDEAGKPYPTVAGLLMAGREPQKFLPNAFIQAVAYQGEDIQPAGETLYQRDAQDITGTVDQQILNACAFVRKNMRIAAYKNTQGGREDVPQFDMLAIFEAVTNAVAHRDYSMYGSKIRLRLFSDRLELYSPGMLTNTMTPESLAYRQSARNEALTSLLARCPIGDESLINYRSHIMDKRGEGVSIILNASEKLSGKRPEYRLNDNSELLLTIYSARVEKQT